MAGAEPEKGDKVSWNWGSGKPGGTVAEKKTSGEVAIKSHRGNTIKKNASPDNPAIHISRSGNDVVKRVSEVNLESRGGSGNKKREHEDDDEAEGETQKKDDGKEIKALGGKDKKAKTGRENKKEEKKADKKEEKKEEKEVTGETKKAGRPKKGDGESKPKTKKTSKPRDTSGVSARTRSRAK